MRDTALFVSHVISQAVQLLEAMNLEASEELDKCIDDLELSAVMTSRVADFQVSATHAALHQIAESLQPKRRAPRGAFAKKSTVSNLLATVVDADGGAGGVAGVALAVTGGGAKPAASPEHAYDDDELEEWQQELLEQRNELEGELATAQRLLEKSRDQIMELQLGKAIKGDRLERLPGARLTETAVQTEPMYEDAVKRELHTQLHAQHEALEETQRKLEVSNEALGILRAPPPPSKPSGAPAAASPVKGGKKQKEEPKKTYLIKGPQPVHVRRNDKCTMTDPPAETLGDGESSSGAFEEASRDRIGELEAEIDYLKMKFSAEMGKMEMRIADLQVRRLAVHPHARLCVYLVLCVALARAWRQSSDSGKTIARLQQSAERYRGAATDVLQKLPMHIYAMLRDDAQVELELTTADMAKIEKKVRRPLPSLSCLRRPCALSRPRARLHPYHPMPAA